MVRAVVTSLLVVLASLGLIVLAQWLSGWTFLSDNPDAVSTFLSSLSQFAAIPITIAFGVIVLIIQQQATAYTSRAGALVVGTPGFMFVVALLFEVPGLCILLLGVLDLDGGSASWWTRAFAAGAVGPVLTIFVALWRFSSVWFGRISPAEFSGFVAKRAMDGAKAGNRNTVSLAVRGLGEMLNNLAVSADHASLRLCMNFVGAFLREYVGDHKPRLVSRRPGFFVYRFPEKRTDYTWVEREAISSVTEAVNVLMARMAPAESIYYLVDGLRPFGGRAAQMEDTEAMTALAEAFVDMGTTEATFAGATNFNTRPLERSAEGAVWARGEDMPEAERLLSASFFVLFAYLNYHVERLTAAGWTYTSSLHETKAREMKDAGIDFSEAAKESRKRFEGYWIIRFQDPDAEQDKALKRIQRLQ